MLNIPISTFILWIYIADEDTVVQLIPKKSYPYLPTPPLGQDMTQGQFLSGVLKLWEFFMSGLADVISLESE